MSIGATEVEIKAVQREKTKRATLQMLLGKKAKRDEFTVPFGPDGEQVSFLFVSMGAKDYDALLTDNPPTAEQRVAGASFNMLTFAPALLSKVCHEPTINVTGWTELWESPDWGRGELLGLFWRASNLCSTEVSAVPIVAD